LYDARLATVFRRPGTGVQRQMAEIEIVCPDCGDKRRVSDDLAGKKIKCRKCQAVFAVKGPAPKAPAPAAKPAAAKPAARAPKPIKPKDEEEDDSNPYTMSEVNLAARCPFCADLLDPPDAKICLNCGYDMLRRRRVESKQVYDQTAADYLIWHLSTILTFVGIVILIGVNVFCLINMRGWVKDAFFEEVMGPDCWSTWLVIMSMFPIFFGTRFIIRKLVWRFHPPEKQVKKGSIYDEE
jgi:ribosomal protein L37AE/L43A